MDSNAIMKRLEHIREEHNRIVDRCQELQSELNNLMNRRVQLEGAFNELNAMYDEVKKSEDAQADVNIETSKK